MEKEKEKDRKRRILYNMRKVLPEMPGHTSDGKPKKEGYFLREFKRRSCPARRQIGRQIPLILVFDMWDF